LWLAGLFYLFATQEGKGYRPIGWIVHYPLLAVRDWKRSGVQLCLEAHVFWTYSRESSASVYRSIDFSSLAVRIRRGSAQGSLDYSLCFASGPNR
jgi:hypothetical protein